jgi:two-component system heavy metal sensor histidine kinase CusS
MPETPTPPPAKHAIGLTTRLVGGYVLVTFLALSAGAAFLYLRLYRSFEIEDIQYLNAHVKKLREEMAKLPTNIHAARELVTNSHAHRKMEAQYGQLSRDGKVIVEAPGFSSLVPDVAAFPKPAGENQEITEVTRYRKSPSSPQLFLVAAMVRRDQTDFLLVYRVALDVSHVEVWMREFRTQLIWVVLGGTTLSGVLAWLLTKQGLSPLQKITAAMKRVGVRDLDKRLGHNSWPRELAATAGEFDQMLDRLRESFLRLSQFSADAAHEFRTPLNSLMLSTSLVLSKNRDSEEYRQALTSNLEQCERLKRLVDSLLFIARADNAEAVLHKSNVDMVMSAAEVLDFFSALAEERGISTHVEGSGTVHGDATLLRLALSNLVSNALRHTASGGSVHITVRETASSCSVEVSDTGEGIAPEHLPRLFDRFYRVDAARRADNGDKGAGLGLALVKTIVQLHGGEVTASSTLGKGTTMRLSLPAGLPP